MSAVMPVGKTCNSRKHLATDFDWEGLEALTLPTANELFHDLREPQLDAMPAAGLSAFSPPGEDTTLDSRQKILLNLWEISRLHRGPVFPSLGLTSSLQVNLNCTLIYPFLLFVPATLPLCSSTRTNQHLTNPT